MMGFGDRFRKLNDDDVPEGAAEDEIAATGDASEGSPEPEGQAGPLDETAATSSDEEPGQEPEAKPRRRLFSRKRDEDVAQDEIAATEDEIAATEAEADQPAPEEPEVEATAEDETAATSSDEEPGQEPEAKPRRRLFSRKRDEDVAQDEIAATEDEIAATEAEADQPAPEEPEVEATAEDETAATSSDEEPGQEPEAKPRRRLFSRKRDEDVAQDEIAATEDEIAATEDEADQPAHEPETHATAEDETAATEGEGEGDGSDTAWDPDELIEIPASDEAAATTSDPEPEPEPESPREPRRRPFSRRPKAERPAKDEIAATEVEDDDAPTAEQPAIAEMTATGEAPRRKGRRPFSRRRKRGPAEPEIAASTAIDEETRRAEHASLYSKFRRPNGSRGRGGAGGQDGIPPLMRAFNLLPEEGRTETRHFQTKPVHLMLGALIPIAFVAVGLMYFTSEAAKSDKQAERDEISARLTALRAQQQEEPVASDPLASQALAAGTAQWTSTVATALSERVSWDRVLQDADRVLPPDTYFETLAAAPGSGTAEAAGATSTTSTTDAAATETAGSGLSRLTITGFAPDHETVAIYLRRVQTLRDVDSASLTSTARAGTLGVLRFIIEAEVRPSR